MPAKAAKERKAKSGLVEAADRHERAEDYLSPGEVARLLDAAEPGRHGVHPHALRHACSAALADRGHDLRLIQGYIGHRNSEHAARCTRVAGSRFARLWR